MKIHVLSDIHLDINDMPVYNIPGDIGVYPGDIGAGTKGLNWLIKMADINPNIPIIYVLGNHDYYGSHMGLVNKLKMISIGNIHILDTNHIDIHGYRFIGGTMWTDYSNGDPIAKLDAQHYMNDFRKIRGKTFSRLNVDKDILPAHYGFRKYVNSNITDKTVIVTHHAPSLKCIDHAYVMDRLIPCYASDMDKDIQKWNPLLWIHGHIHDSIDIRVHNTRIVCNPRGYDTSPGNTNFVVDIPGDK